MSEKVEIRRRTPEEATRYLVEQATRQQDSHGDRNLLVAIAMDLSYIRTSMIELTELVRRTRAELGLGK